jgi:hypothetical protein
VFQQKNSKNKKKFLNESFSLQEDNSSGKQV